MGGEPTLNPYLTDVIDALKGKCSINIDTNGTLEILNEIIEQLSSAHVLVRITLDSLDEETLRIVRPPKNHGLKQIPVIEKNITALLKKNVPLMIHTVATQININQLEIIAKRLCELGVKRWHIYGVNYSEKCKNIYENIKISKKQLYNAYMCVKRKFADKIEMSVYYDEYSYNADSVLMIDSNGMYYLDSIKNGIHYIGANPRRPTIAEIHSELDINLHKGYLWTPDIL